MNQWIKEELSKCLHFEVPKELIAYIYTIQSADEIDGYFRTLLDYNNPQHTAFMRELKIKLGHATSTEAGNVKSAAQAPASGKGKQQTKQQQTKSSKTATASASTGSSSTGKPSAQESSSGKKKTKYVNLYGQDGGLADFVLLKGRHHCDCQASKHRLINNCIHCGRIVCEQEGSGPCLFCGSLVCTEQEQRMIESTTRKGDNLRRSLMEQNRPAGWEEALAMRNRLLEYDRNSEKRTTVIDDEADYFKTHSIWLSDAERKKLAQLEEELREKRHASRLARKVTLDFAGRQVLDEAVLSTEDMEEIFRQASLVDSPQTERGKENNDPGRVAHDNDDVHPSLYVPAPTFIDSTLDGTTVPSTMSSASGYDGVYSRVQDKEFLEMSDLRHCLSMHQPWASLLVAGIKRHEGRTWYSSHRGRLWIAATAKPVCPDTVQELEHFYRKLYEDDTIQFPTQYPAGCLLGCVSVKDCLPQEEYRKQHPNGESDSPFVFVCEEPQELPIRFPLKGDHKIYMLDSRIHQAAVKALQRLAKQNKELAD
ncbi:activating signal cointegrator 1 [Anopheles maculipalpis]|uniref:activating signal cointegrator 1 n=1 Tax=Anopheles maculipalpis TaxID=1496333 RepID=UPI00215905DD|nr:activating signal cointegrator 1 [Anopheles maculipalpis]